LEELGADARIILKWIFNKWNGRHALDWPGSKLRQVAALVNAVTNIRAPQNVEKFLIS
jgi:hypothetical protein